MQNTKPIQQAIEDYLADQGLTAEALGPRLGVSSSTSIRWASGKSRTIRAAHWKKLKPLLQPYLSNDALADLAALSRSLPSFRQHGLYASVRGASTDIEANECYAEFDQIRRGEKPCPGCLVMAANVVDMASRLSDITPENREALRQAAALMRQGAPGRRSSSSERPMTVSEARRLAAGEATETEEGKRT